MVKVCRAIVLLLLPSIAGSQETLEELLAAVKRDLIEAGCGADSSVEGLDLREEDCTAGNYVCIRVENLSDLDFDRVVMHFPDEAEDFGAIAAGGMTPYRRVGCAYRRNGAEAWSGDMHFAFGVIDHVGDSFLSPGTYTYAYSATLFTEPRTGDDWILHGSLVPEDRRP